jgi:hypothetical protein
MKIQVLGVDDTLKFMGISIEQEVSRVADVILDEAKKATPIRSGRARRNWTKNVRRQDFTVENTVPYIGRLEEGYSKQAPNGITAPTIRRAKRRLK